MATAKKKSFDVFDIDPKSACDAGADIELVHPASGRALGVFLRVVGKDGQVFTDMTREKTRQQLLKGFSEKNAKQDKTPDQQAEEALKNIFSTENELDTATRCTVGWWRFQDEEKRTGKVETLYFQGGELEFSPDNARKVFEARPWIMDQAIAAIGDLRIFMTG